MLFPFFGNSDNDYTVVSQANGECQPFSLYGKQYYRHMHNVDYIGVA